MENRSKRPEKKAEKKLSKVRSFIITISQSHGRKIPRS